ncbi:MAG: fructose-bisphosphate aldolase, partial [Methanomicrobiales archaeon]|nr:fructose-bisphosphate aldolase [Methanomicrobiales archaeon]
NYPGDPEAFHTIAESCSVPVLIAGGEKISDLEALQQIRDAVHAGAAGVCVGRNAFQRENPREFVQALCRVVHDEIDPVVALGKQK